MRKLDKLGGKVIFYGQVKRWAAPRKPAKAPQTAPPTPYVKPFGG
jgi:hypothetical protein